MGMTITEKIIARHANRDYVKPSEIVEVDVDWCMVNDVTIPMIRDIFYGQFGFANVFDNQKVVFIMDHRIPSDSVDTAEGHKISRAFGNELGIKVHNSDGVCHQVMFEHYVKPGNFIVAADSHTCSYGCIGAVSAGMGATDIAAIMGTGRTWLKVPKTIKVVISGKPKKYVYAKDVILYIIKKISSSGANYKTLEFEGEYVDSLSVSERFTLCNMVIEAGGKSAMIAPNTLTKEMYRNDDIDWEMLQADPDAQYSEIIVCDISELQPQVACPHYVDNVMDIDCVEGVKVDQAFLGGCTNGRLDDLKIAAEMLNGKSVHPNVRLLVTPASVTIYKAAIQQGIVEIFVNAGAIINHPGCSTCWGSSIGSLASGDVMISSTNRNFKGRAGSPQSSIYLASPAVVVASAINGCITKPEKEMKL